MQIALKRVSLSEYSEDLTPTDKYLEQLRTVQILLGMSGKMYIPTTEQLIGESFAMVRPYCITSGHTPQQCLEHWNAKGQIFFDDNPD